MDRSDFNILKHDDIENKEEYKEIFRKFKYKNKVKLSKKIETAKVSTHGRGELRQIPESYNLCGFRK